MRSLVTGATGFVGANLVRALLAAGDRVWALARPGSDPWRLDAAAADLHHLEADVEDRPAIERAMAEARPDRVFHLAAHGAYWWQGDLATAIGVNLTGTLHVVTAAARAGAGAVICAGSSSEYGRRDHAPREDECLDPESGYAVGKAAASLLVRHLGRDRGLPVLILRLYSVYGPYEEPNRLVPALVLEGRRGRLPPLANPATARDFVHSDDVSAAFIAAAERAPGLAGQAFNIGTGVQVSLAQAAEQARRQFGIAAEPAWGSMGDRPGDTATWVADPTRAAAALGWRARHDFASGLARTAAWFDAHPELVRRYEEVRTPGR